MVQEINNETFAVDCRNGTEGVINGTLQAKSNGGISYNLNNVVRNHYAVRRLTPIECERLQGWPDNYTNVMHNGKPASDSARYKALGNGMAQPCPRWILKRLVEEMENEESE
jgi:DNA (cytosine-5)-methyltransferase 1